MKIKKEDFINNPLPGSWVSDENGFMIPADDATKKRYGAEPEAEKKSEEKENKKLKEK